jgi:hypothetical protein
LPSQHEPSQALVPQHSHIAITSFLVARGREGTRSPGTDPGSRGPASLQHAEQFGPKHRQPLDFLPDLNDTPPQQACSGLARAHAGIADGEQLADLRQPQPEPLRAADEQQPVHISPPVPAMFAFSPLRDRQQAFPFVVPDRVGSHSDARSQLPDRQRSDNLIDPHATNAKPWTALQVQGPVSGRSVPAACPTGQLSGGSHGQQRTARYADSPAYRQADPLREPNLQASDQPGAKKISHTSRAA